MTKMKDPNLKAVLLCAGKSTRTWPLTLTRPKPLLKVANKTILRHNLDQLSGLVGEAILVIGYMGDMIKKSLEGYDKLKLSFVEQKEQLGTGHALMLTEHLVNELADGQFLLMMGDDLYFKEDLARLVEISSEKGTENAALVFKSNNPSQYGVVSLNPGNTINHVSEKPAKPESDLVTTGCYLFDKRIFSLLKELKKSARNEYELTDAVNALANETDLHPVKAAAWFPITYPWNLLEANEFLLSRMKVEDETKGVVEDGAVIKGEVFVGEGAIVKSGAYIEGPVMIGNNSVIGPNCYLRAYTSIGNSCKVGNAVEIKNSILFDKVSVGHLSYVGDSVIGEGTNIGAGTITANLRHDNGNVKSMVKEELIDTGRRKLGTIIGDDVHTGINTSIYPGRKLWPGTSTRPGEIVRKDITEKCAE